MGWAKLYPYIVSGNIVIGNWQAEYNNVDNSIDITHISDAIPYIHNDTVFSGNHYYTEVNGGVLQIQSFPGWADTVGPDETYALDDTTSWDELSGGEVLLNYSLNSSSTVVAWEGKAIFESSDFPIDKVGVVNSSLAQWVDNVPAGASVILKAAIFDGYSWSTWSTMTKGSAVSVIPNGVDMGGYRLKYRAELTATSGGQSPTISSVTITLNSRRHFRIFSSGVLKESSYVTTNVIPNATESI